MRAGTRALVLAAIATPARTVTAGLPPTDRLALSQNPYGSLDALIEDCRAAAADALIATPADRCAVRTASTPWSRRFAPIWPRPLPHRAPGDPDSGWGTPVSAALADTAERDIADDVRHQLAIWSFQASSPNGAPPA